MIGASGAISGVLGAYLLLFPRARVLVLIPFGFLTRVMPVPAIVVLGFWIVMQIINGAFSWGGLGGGVAWFAHIGGVSAGLALIKVFQRRPVNDIFLWEPSREACGKIGRFCKDSWRRGAGLRQGLLLF